MLPFLLLLLVAPALGQEVGTLTVTAPTELVPQAAALPEPEGAQTGDGVERTVRVFNLTSLLISYSDPNRLGSTDCDVNPAASVPTLNVAGGWYSATTCINAASNRLQLQAVVRNPSGFNSFGLYIGNGAQCPSSSATLWNPNDFSWTSSNSYTGQTAAVFRASQCTSNVACCAVIVCNNIAFNCADMTAAVSFIQNPLPTTCGGSNLGLSRIPSGSLSRAIGCTLSGAITNGTTQDFSVTNPNRHTLTVWVTDGTGPLGCGLPDTNPTGAFSYNFYQRRVDTTATSISFSGVQCNSTQCCAIILCSGANDFGCYGISYSQAISRPNRPPPAAPAQESARSLAAGIVVAIVIGALVVSCAAAFYVRRKYHSEQTTTYGNYGNTTIVMNPVSLPAPQPDFSAPPPQAYPQPYPQAPMFPQSQPPSQEYAPQFAAPAPYPAAPYPAAPYPAAPYPEAPYPAAAYPPPPPPARV